MAGPWRDPAGRRAAGGRGVRAASGCAAGRGAGCGAAGGAAGAGRGVAGARRACRRSSPMRRRWRRSLTCWSYRGTGRMPDSGRGRLRVRWARPGRAGMPPGGTRRRVGQEARGRSRHGGGNVGGGGCGKVSRPFRRGGVVPGGEVAGPVRRGWLRLRYGRPGWLAVRVVLAAVVPLVAQFAAPGDPAVPALAVGSLTWLVLTARFDLGPRARR